MNLSLNKSSRAVKLIRKFGIAWALLALVVVISIFEPAFFSKNNFLNILKQSSTTGIMAVGMAIVIITGGIDLSVGSILAVSCMVAAFCTTSSGGHAPLPVFAAILLGALAGAAFGLLNGVGVAYIGFAPFVATMATLSIGRGISLVLSNSKSVFNLTSEFIAVANTKLLGIPSLVYFWLAVVLIFMFIMGKSVFGKWIYAIGGNENAAILSGVNSKLIKTAAYVICGALSGLTGVLMASRVTSGQPAIGEGYELDAIAACVIGGISMTGGRGTIFGTVLGTLILTIISNGFDIMGIPSNYQKIMKGVVILLAVFVDLRTKAGKKRIG